MSGYVYIAKDKGFAMSSMSFNAIILFSRDFLRDRNASLEHLIYEPIEVGDADFISLTDLNSNQFLDFYKVMTSVNKFCKTEKKCGNLDPKLFPAVMDVWDRFLIALEMDNRIASDCSIE